MLLLMFVTKHGGTKFWKFLVSEVTVGSLARP